MLKKLKNNTIITIELQQEDGNTIELTDQQDIESAYIQENMRKYSQTNNTICMQEPLRSLLGKTGHTLFTDTILDGTAEFPPNTPQYTKEFLQQMKRSPRAQETNW